MNMTQLIIGTALGFIIAQGAQHTLRTVGGWLHSHEVVPRLLRRVPVPRPRLIGGFVRYAAPIGAAVAMITLGVWAVSDYFAARAARRAEEAAVLSPLPTLEVPDTHDLNDDSSSALPAPPPKVASLPDASEFNPYADADFKVPKRRRQAGAELLVQRAEQRARSDLLKEMQAHASRSQYDCEAVDRANRYLKAGLDVWGFNAWQSKYFPLDGYQGATLAQCRDIPKLIDLSQLDVHSAVVQTN